ncbi:MAG: ornithine carbamoyltransferase [Candidatus Omnitrophota bacterium]
MKRDLLSLQDFSSKEIEGLLAHTIQLKSQKGKNTDQLKEKSVALVFQKPSNRTRVSFEIGIWQLGGKSLYLSPREIDLGKRESTADVAKTLSRYVHCIVARTNAHKDIIELAQNASVPIINGLSDLFHPCQGLADIFTVKEKFSDLESVTLAYIGDGNNVCHSLLLGCAKVGINIKVATPKGYEPKKDIIKIAQAIAKESGSKIELSYSPQEAAKNANVLYADVWVSMGQEEETKKRLGAFKEFQVNERLAQLADKNYIFMHCLPAHRGQEVTSDILDGPHSVVFDQAENRMHVQKAILLFLLGIVK